MSGPSTSGTTGPLEVDTKSSKDPQKPDTEEEAGPVLPRLSEQLLLEELWDILGECLTELAKTPDHHAVLVLQPAVEAFFLVHAGMSEKQCQIEIECSELLVCYDVWVFNVHREVCKG